MPARIPALALALVLAGAWAPAGGESARYRMYRNPPKPRIAVMPMEAAALSAPARARLAAALAKEVRGLEGFRFVALPSADTAARETGPGAMAGLRERDRLDLALRARADSARDSVILAGELLDVRAGTARAGFRLAARGPVDSLLARLGDEVRRLALAPKVRELRCDEGMALVPAADTAKLPAPPAGTDRPGDFGPGAFCVDLYEYPNKPSGEPLVGKTWREAEALCAARGKRLCSEAEWELACGGWEGRTYPYGEAYDAERCNTRSRTIRLAGGMAGCRSPFGAFDLAGNVYEWTASSWGGRHAEKVVKGGNWGAGAESSTCGARFGADPEAPSSAIGFRCCQFLAP